MIVGYAKGTRSSDESALGGSTPEVIVDNTRRWTGDHCMDPASVPGILLTSRPLPKGATTLQTLRGGDPGGVRHRGLPEYEVTGSEEA